MFKNALVTNGISKARAIAQRKAEQGVKLFGVELRDAREELFAVMVCDGLSLGIAFRKAGFDAADPMAPSKLFAVQRVQQRVAAIFDERRKHAAVSLPEVTDMLQRVFSKALHDDQMNAAHNAAFSLARLYGHVTDRAVIETLRKPSRDPDAPAERSLTNWIDALPFKGPSPEGSQSGVQEGPDNSLAEGPDNSLAETASPSPRRAIEGSGLGAATQGSGLGATYSRVLASPEGSDPEGSGLGDGHRQSGNEAPLSRVTGTPVARVNSAVLSPDPLRDVRTAIVAKMAVSRETIAPTPIQKRERKKNKVPVLSGAQKRKIKRMKELFG